MSDLYSQAGDQWIGMALQQRHMGSTEQALQAYDGAFKRFAETAHSVPLHQEMRKRAIPNPNPTPTPNQVPLHQEMRKSYTDLSECPPVDTTVATKLKAQRAFSAGMSVYSWHAQTFLLPADFLQFERTYKARRSPCPARHRRRAPPRCTPLQRRAACRDTHTPLALAGAAAHAMAHQGASAQPRRGQDLKPAPEP